MSSSAMINSCKLKHRACMRSKERGQDKDPDLSKAYQLTNRFNSRKSLRHKIIRTNSLNWMLLSRFTLGYILPCSKTCHLMNIKIQKWRIQDSIPEARFEDCLIPVKLPSTADLGGCFYPLLPLWSPHSAHKENRHYSRPQTDTAHIEEENIQGCRQGFRTFFS